MSNSSLASLSAKQLKKAAKVRERLDKLQTQLENILGVSATPSEAASSGRKSGGKATRRRRRKVSAAARAKLSAAAKRRWAKRKAAGKSTL
jgi:uncharacterized protein YoxC